MRMRADLGFVYESNRFNTARRSRWQLSGFRVLTRSWRQHAAESEVVCPRVDLALAARANHVTGAILIGAKKRTAFVNALFLYRLGGIKGQFLALRVCRDAAWRRQLV
jgi:hypothetical protein